MRVRLLTGQNVFKGSLFDVKETYKKSNRKRHEFKREYQEYYP